jgi:hypothetical protein
MKRAWVGATIASLCVAGCGPLEGEVGEGAVGAGEEATRGGELLLGVLDQDLLMSFAHDPTYDRGAHFGRATARMTATTDRVPFCSAFLIDDRVVATAHHCRAFLGLDGDDPRARFEWGRWGMRDWTGDFVEADDWARERLVDLGFPRADAAAIPQEDMREWTCELIEQDGQRDVDYWRCPRRRLEFEYWGRTLRFELEPGHLWGHVDVSDASFADEDPLYVLGVNAVAPGAAQTALLAPNGRVTQANGACYFESPYTGCFRFDGADTRCGNSGGAVMDTGGHVALGVFSGFDWSDSWVEDGCSWNVYGDGDPTNINIGSYFGARAGELASAPAPGTFRMGAREGRTRWQGKPSSESSGYRVITRCPEHTLASGLVGHGVSLSAFPSVHEYLGSLGLLCTPHNHQGPLHLDRAQVPAGHSVAVDYAPSWGEDFNTYMVARRWLDFDSGLRERQRVVSCPPGYFIKAMTLYDDDSGIRRIKGLLCEDPQTGDVGVTAADDKLGSKAGGSFGSHGCGAGAYVSGLDITSLWITEGFAVECTFED